MGPIRIGAMLLALGLAVGAAMAQAAPPGAPPQQVDGPESSTLIRSTLIALHQANVTGNYTVLRDLGASVMQSANTAADLAARFADFRQKQISLAPAVLFDAILDDKPKLSTDGALRLVGHFPTKPQEIVFDLTFLYERGVWRVAQLSVGTRVPTAEPAAAAKPPLPKPGSSSNLVPAQVPVPRPAPKP